MAEKKCDSKMDPKFAASRTKKGYPSPPVKKG